MYSDARNRCEAVAVADIIAAFGVTRGDVGHNRHGLPQVCVPGPGHRASDRSLAITFDPRGRLLVHSYAGDDARACLDYARDVLGLHGGPGKPVEHKPEPETRDRAESARRLFHGIGRPLHSGAARAYFAGRGLKVPDMPHEVREAPPYAKSNAQPEGTHTVVLYALRALECSGDSLDGRSTLVAIQRVWLDRGGRKLGRGAVGLMMGSAFMPSPWAEVERGLFVAEGAENALAMLERGLAPAWALMSAGGLANLPVLGGVEALTIIADHDARGTGEAAAWRAADRWRTAGGEVRVFKPRRVGQDFNDVHQGRV